MKVVEAGRSVLARARRRRSKASPSRSSSRLLGFRRFGDPTGRAVLVPPPLAHPPSYLDDPEEQRRYTVRWVLTMAILGALAILLVWALGELVGSWGSFLDMFRGRPPAGPFTNALVRFPML